MKWYKATFSGPKKVDKEDVAVSWKSLITPDSIPSLWEQVEFTVNVLKPLALINMISISIKKLSFILFVSKLNYFLFIYITESLVYDDSGTEI